jgi:hypothetical protein
MTGENEHGQGSRDRVPAHLAAWHERDRDKPAAAGSASRLADRLPLLQPSQAARLDISLEGDPTFVVRGRRWPVCDRDDGGAGQPFAQQAIERSLRLRIEIRGRLIKEQPIGLGEQDACDG